MSVRANIYIIFAATMNRRLLLFIAILFASVVSAGAATEQGPGETQGHEQEQTTGRKAIKGFSGGMMVHTGYLTGCDNPYNYNPSGATFGIGGVAKIHLTQHFRVGFEGYFSNMGLKKEVQSGSFNKLFWTGALVDWFWKAGKFYPYVGATVGGGMETAYYMFEGDKHDWLPEPNAVFNKKPFFAVDPFVGVEYAVGEALRLTLKADWLLAVNSEGLNRPMGPRIYFGFIFAH